MAENFKNRIETINSELSNPSSKFSKEDLEQIGKELENLYICINEIFLKLAEDIKNVCSAFETFKVNTLLNLENNISINGEVTEQYITDILHDSTIQILRNDGKVFKVFRIDCDSYGAESVDITEEYIKEHGDK